MNGVSEQRFLNQVNNPNTFKPMSVQLIVSPC